MKEKYQVYVGNIGMVLETKELSEAIDCFREYLFQSQSGYGKASGESVCVMADNEPLPDYDFDGESGPMVEDVEKLLIHCMGLIDDDSRASDDPEDDMPGMQVTIATNDGQEYVYQSGDNSYSGACYHCHYWSVIYLYPGSDCKELAMEAVSELFESVGSETISN